MQPIVVTGIKAELIKNPIKLAKLLNKEKPNATIRETKLARNNNLLIFPNDAHSANILLKPWKQNSELGNPKPRVPQQKENQLYCIVICGLSPDIPETQIVNELEDLGFKPKFAKRLISKITQAPTWKMKIAFEEQNDQEELIKEGIILGYQKHRVEKYAELPTILQCYRCQGFGHTFHKCENEQKCLRCGDNHSIKNCKKEKAEKKCANCGGDHISSYKGCPVYFSARQEVKQQPKQKTYAQATKIEVSNKLPRNEKINITLFCSELIRTCLMKCNIKIKTSDVLAYSANLALAHLGLVISGEELFNILKNPQFPEHAEAIEKIRRNSDEGPS
ncbi:hypothetical protein HOLleu_08934 [Holothuria leucospilota]|uniref:Nucleic-acid-binding protein from transposon X-element n=1 Tax=Holothuria leucospilota TaxID=206669 RepID=A0A9Q1CIB2_HOLLE|nr:hypothetical protein HOLleu_08934 [Holothuria leucospilota]